MAATDFGTSFLDSSLRIKRLTQHVMELFSITPADEDRLDLGFHASTGIRRFGQ
jgi:hypothetical protein